MQLPDHDGLADLPAFRRVLDRGTRGARWGGGAVLEQMWKGLAQMSWPPMEDLCHAMVPMFNATGTSQLNYDFVYVFDGTSTATPSVLKGQWSGTTMPSIVTATSGR
jgi:hypothetical protein